MPYSMNAWNVLLTNDGGVTISYVEAIAMCASLA
jgi:hypothetical protein